MSQRSWLIGSLVLIVGWAVGCVSSPIDPPTGVCSILGAGTVCRDAVGPCDVAEVCSSGSADCPANVFAAATVECRAAAGACDVAESCSGSEAACPDDNFADSTVECRASAGDCDVAESCTGTAASCPGDAFAPPNVECRASDGICNPAESCSGLDAACPGDVSPATVDAPSLIDASLSVSAVLASTSVTVRWSAVSFPGGAEYMVEWSTDNTFATGVAASAWQAETSFDVPLAASATHAWRVTARDPAMTTCMTTTSAVGTISFNEVPGLPTNLSKVIVQSPYDGTTPEEFIYWVYDLSWDAAVDPEGDSLEYLAEVHADPDCNYPYEFQSPTSVLVKSSGWQSELTWRADELPGYESNSNSQICLGFRVRARDAHGISEWAYDVNTFGSCPFLFVWNGEEYAFESDVFPQGRVGTMIQGAYARPFPQDYYVLQNTPVATGGEYVMQLTNERAEVDYLDHALLYAVYIPEGYALHSEKPTLGATSFDPAEGFHTTAETLSVPVSVTHVNTGADVTALLSASDHTYLEMNDDPNQAVYQTLELDLGDLSSAPMIKIVIDGRTLFPTTPAGLAFVSAQGPRTRVEVPNGSGGWTQVSSSEVRMSPLAAFRRPIILDLTGRFPTADYRVRLTWVHKTYMDAVSFDTTADQPFEMVALPLEGADLHYRGTSEPTAGEVYDLLYDRTQATRFEPYPGAYTRFGDISELLTQADDKHVISFGGDELTLRFTEAPAPGAGETVRFVLFTHGYYKDGNTNLAKTVEPLPFAAMSNYPYPGTESYPNGVEYDAYRNDWNTRVYY